MQIGFIFDLFIRLKAPMWWLTGTHFINKWSGTQHKQYLSTCLPSPPFSRVLLMPVTHCSVAVTWWGSVKVSNAAYVLTSATVHKLICSQVTYPHTYSTGTECQLSPQFLAVIVRCILFPLVNWRSFGRHTYIIVISELALLKLFYHIHSTTHNNSISQLVVSFKTV